jgi:hypothetical protein
MLKPSSLAAACLLVGVQSGTAALVHVWEKQELTFTSARPYTNPYTEVTLWVDLLGPGFRKRVYGFWDGGTTFRVRVLATSPRKMDLERWLYAVGSVANSGERTKRLRFVNT